MASLQATEGVRKPQRAPGWKRANLICPRFLHVPTSINETSTLGRTYTSYTLSVHVRKINLQYIDHSVSRSAYTPDHHLKKRSQPPPPVVAALNHSAFSQKRPYTKSTIATHKLSKPCQRHLVIVNQSSIYTTSNTPDKNEANIRIPPRCC